MSARPAFARVVFGGAGMLSGLHIAWKSCSIWNKWKGESTIITILMKKRAVLNYSALTCKQGITQFYC